MNSKRKSFILHLDSLDILDELSDEQAGQLLKAFRDFHNDAKCDLNNVIKLVFLPFKNQFIRDNKKYENTCQARRKAGSKGGKQTQANASKSKQKVANQADSDSKSDSKSKSVSVNTSATNRFGEFWNLYN